MWSLDVGLARMDVASWVSVFCGRDADVLRTLDDHLKGTQGVRIKGTFNDAGGTRSAKDIDIHTNEINAIPCTFRSD